MTVSFLSLFILLIVSFIIIGKIFALKNLSIVRNKNLLISHKILTKRTYRTSFSSLNMLSIDSNPLVSSWNTPCDIPPFNLIQAGHFESAFHHSMKLHINELDAIANNKESPTFDNTIVQLDRAGSLLTKISKVFQNLCSSNCPTDLQDVQRIMGPPLAEHESLVYQYPNLFNRIDHIHQSRHNLQLNSEQIRVVERFHLDFTRAGAKFDKESQAKYTTIMKELSALQIQFSQNVMTDESECIIELSDADVAGLPAFLVSSLAQAAKDNKRESGYIINLSRSLVAPFLSFSPVRELRKKGMYNHMLCLKHTIFTYIYKHIATVTHISHSVGELDEER